MTSISHAKHKRHYPPPERDFNSHIPEEKNSTKPRHPRKRQFSKSFFHPIVRTVCSTTILRAELSTIRGPEGRDGGYEGEGCEADLIPQLAFISNWKKMSEYTIT